MYNMLYNGGYFIGIGGEGKMFTLRQATRAGREYHIRNLGHDMETSERKAKEITGIDLEAPSMILNPLASKVTREDATMPYGKYKGQLLTDVIENDLGYLVWWSNNAKEFYEADPDAKVKRLDKIIMEAPEVVAEVTRRNEAYAARKAIWEAENDALRESSVHLGTVGERIEFTGTIVFEKYSTHPDYDWVMTKVHTDDGCEVMYWNTFKACCKEFGLTDHKPEAQKGDRITFWAAVKEHGEYNGVKQTTVSRATKCKLLGASKETEHYINRYN